MKINVASNVNAKKYRHNLTHRVSTTSNFGFMQPIMCREVSPDTSIKLRVGQSVFLEPMSKPTFGACSVRTYTSFVPIADIWHPFESFLAAQTYRGANAHYIPTAVPNAPQGFLNMCVKMFSDCYIWTVTDPTQGVNLFSGKLTPSNSTGIGSRLVQKWNTELSANVFNTSILSSRLQIRKKYPTYSTPPSLDELDWYEVVSDSSATYLIGGIYSGYARDLRKILIGCGYQLNASNAPVSLLPLFAYYKAYFDLFYPARDLTWKDTQAFGFMESIEQSNSPAISAWGTVDTTRNLWLGFLDELANAFYTQNPDYVSAHITGTQLPISTANSSVSFVDPEGNADHVSAGTAHQAEWNIDTSSGDTYQLGGPALTLLRRLTQRLNSHTAIGGRIREFLRSVFNSDYRDEKESNFIGSQITNIDISEVMSQAETSEGYLGEYAGKGRAVNPGNYNTFTSHDFGFVVTMIGIVPDSRYCQAVDPLLRHVGRRDFYDRMIDSTTLVPTPKYCIYGCQDLSTEDSYNTITYNNGFGNIPAYMEYKQAYDVLNGQMSQPSKRSSYLPFTLDKILPFSWHFEGNGTTWIYNFASLDLVNGSIWRYIGKDQWLGYFNRIFINSGKLNGFAMESDNYRFNQVDDNFIIHNYIDLNVTAQWLPVADSFDTGSLEQDSMKVEKA